MTSRQSRLPERRLGRLVPAFDLNPFPGRALTLKTWISEEAGTEATNDGLMSIRAYCRLSLAEAKEMLGHVEAAVSSWRRKGRVVGGTRSLRRRVRAPGTPGRPQTPRFFAADLTRCAAMPGPGARAAAHATAPDRVTAS